MARRQKQLASDDATTTANCLGPVEQNAPPQSSEPIPALCIWQVPNAVAGRMTQEQLAASADLSPGIATIDPMESESPQPLGIGRDKQHAASQQCHIHRYSMHLADQSSGVTCAERVQRWLPMQANRLASRAEGTKFDLRLHLFSLLSFFLHQRSLPLILFSLNPHATYSLIPSPVEVQAPVHPRLPLPPFSVLSTFHPRRYYFASASLLPSN